MKYIQSFYQYPVTFSSLGKTIPAKDADGELRNIAEFEDEEIEVLRAKEPFFRELENLKKIRVLNHLPESYKPATALVNEANDRAAAAEAKVAELEARLAQQENPDGAAPAAEAQNANEGTEGPAPEGQEPNDEAPTAPKPFEEWDYKELQAWAKDHGVENVNIKKAELVEACKALTGSVE